jgi:hypothetical protein
MPFQPTLPELDQPHSIAPPPRTASSMSAPAPVWLQRVSLIIFVIFCFYVGGVLTILPWSAGYWEQNGWLLGHPALNAFMQQAWLRGIVSGIGLLDIWIAISELLHYKDYRPPKETL